MTDIALRCTGLVKRYDRVVAVDGLDLKVHAGECFGLLGPNGAGKTTTVEIFEGLLVPDAGTVEVLGHRWGHDGQTLQQQIGIALQETQFADKLTVRETITLFRSFYHSGRTVDEVLAIVQLEEKADAWIRKLSGGQRQRLSVACALVGDPELLFLDEPTTGLDPQSRRQIWDVISEYRRGGRTVLLTTHYMEEAQRLCDRVAIVDKGRVIAQGTPAELIATLGAEHVVEFEAEAELDSELLAALPGVGDLRRDGNAVLLTAREVHRAVPALLAVLASRDVALTRLVTHHATLEDVFVALTGRHLRDG